MSVNTSLTFTKRAPKKCKRASTAVDVQLSADVTRNEATTKEPGLTSIVKGRTFGYFNACIAVVDQAVGKYIQIRNARKVNASCKVPNGYIVEMTMPDVVVTTVDGCVCIDGGNCA